MKLYLVRHGEALSERENSERPLSPEGSQDVRRVAEFLKTAGVKVDEIYHSPLKRAQETAAIIKSAIQPSAKMTVKDVSPNDDTDRLIDELVRRQQDLMIVSHLPFLPKLIAKLVIKDESANVIGFSTSSVLAMYRDREGRWQIVWLVSPELLAKKR